MGRWQDQEMGKYLGAILRIRKEASMVVIFFPLSMPWHVFFERSAAPVAAQPCCSFLSYLDQGGYHGLGCF